LRRMPLRAGAHLGPYEILAAIGAGGMGEALRTIPIAWLPSVGKPRSPVTIDSVLAEGHRGQILIFAFSPSLTDLFHNPWRDR
jgi:hypothetical protein